MTVNDAISVLEDAVSNAVIAKADRLEVVHGIGNSRVKNAVHEHLKTLKCVKGFNVMQFNPGTTMVFL